MEMTFDEYIVNPMGIKNSVFSKREMYRTLYRQKLDAILVRETGRVKYKLYKDKNDNYYAWFKIPSEVISNFYYDTVIKFYTKTSKAKISKTLKDYYVKFYSNDPSFVYTFAFAMEKNKLFIDELSSVMSKEALTTRAKEKNPKAEIGYVKSLFFAYLLMKQYSLFDKLLYEQSGSTLNIKDLLSNITPADKKISDRQEAARELSKNKKIEKIKKEKTNDIERPSNNTKLSMKTNVSKISSGMKKINKVKGTGRIKRF